LLYRNILIALACLFAFTLGVQCAWESTTFPAPGEYFNLRSEVSTERLAVIVPITLTFESLSWTIKPTEILVDNWRTRWAIDEQKLEILVAAIAAEIDKTNPAPKLGPNDYLIDAGGPRLDREAAKLALRETLRGGTRQITLKADQVSPQVGKLLRPAPAGGGVLYLTFDDAMTLAPEIMNVAESYGARVTFFPIGETVTANPGVATNAAQRGHAVQTHGYLHLAHKGKSLEWQIDNIQKGVNSTYAAAGIRPTLFRPPFGSYDENTKIAAATVGVTMVLWSVSSSDSIQISSEQIRINVLSRAQNGSVVLMHAWNSNTLAALPKILAAAKEQNYRAVTLW
jgi:peptidoglycan/xylan/chitin deacetylase (PgdA/CDA1 family)